jgi:hypothetical protein
VSTTSEDPIHTATQKIAKRQAPVGRKVHAGGTIATLKVLKDTVGMKDIKNTEQGNMENNVTGGHSSLIQNLRSVMTDEAI